MSEEMKEKEKCLHLRVEHMSDHMPEPYYWCEDCKTEISEEEYLAKSSPVIVPADVSADIANGLYGERYGVDWEYPDIDSATPSQL